MQQKLKYLAFTLVTIFLSSISSADFNYKFYALVSNNSTESYSGLYIYPLVQEGTKITRSFTINHSIDDLKPNAIAIKPGVNLLFVSSAAEHRVFICKLTRDKGSVGECKANDFPIENPMGMAFLGDQFFVTDKDKGEVVTCKLEDEDLTRCHYVASGIKGANQISVSVGSNNAYILQTSKNAVTQCHFDYGDYQFHNCKEIRLFKNGRPVNPTAMTTAGTANHLYFLSGNKHIPNGIFCEVPTGADLHWPNCKYADIIDEDLGTAMLGLGRDFIGKDHAFVSAAHKVYRCKMDHANFERCDEFIPNIGPVGDKNSNIYGLAYRIIEND